LVQVCFLKNAKEIISCVTTKTKNTWILAFEPSDKNSNPFIKCKGSEVTVWEAEKGYLVGDSIVILNDPLDQVP
jgi:hypothetical protein